MFVHGYAYQFLLFSNVSSYQADLSQRLQEVLEYIAAGKTTREIADEMILSPKTVEKYRSQILRKLDARNQIEAIQKAVELGLLSQQSRR